MKLFHYAAPQHFYPLAGRLWPVLALLATGRLLSCCCRARAHGHGK
jgi:heme exporter protein C